MSQTNKCLLNFVKEVPDTLGSRKNEKVYELDNKKKIDPEYKKQASRESSKRNREKKKKELKGLKKRNEELLEEQESLSFKVQCLLQEFENLKR